VSALGQKQPHALQKAMSALPPKAANSGHAFCPVVGLWAEFVFGLRWVMSVRLADRASGFTS
jgi:hypothetical protein